jgi:plasmid stabilization system protein ParE
MKPAVHISARAWRDADEILQWLNSRSPAGANAWLNAFLSAVNGLAEAHDAFGFSAEGNMLGRPTRERIFKTRSGANYRALYQVKDNIVIILRIRGPGQPPLAPDELEHK